MKMTMSMLAQRPRPVESFAAEWRLGEARSLPPELCAEDVIAYCRNTLGIDVRDVTTAEDRRHSGKTWLRRVCPHCER